MCKTGEEGIHGDWVMSGPLLGSSSEPLRIPVGCLAYSLGWDGYSWQPADVAGRGRMGAKRL